MFDSVAALIAEHEALQVQLADPAVHADAARAKKLNRRYAELSQIQHAHEVWVQAQDDLAAARELAKEDEAFAEEVPALEERVVTTQEKLRRLLIPRDPDDGRDVIMEIKGGEGGEESALFAADLLRMYSYYAESRGWKVEVLDSTQSDMGGFKNVQVAIKSNATDPSQGVWASMKYEGGVHRVQRVPATESQGRIHTSTTGVLVFPEVDEPEEVEINQNDLKIDVYRASGPGGQGVNTADSRAELSWDVARTPALSDELRRRVIERLGGRLVDGVLTIAASEHRSQLRNREAAVARLTALLDDALRPPDPPRLAARPSRASRARRAANERHRREVKSLRQRPSRSDRG